MNRSMPTRLLQQDKLAYWASAWQGFKLENVFAGPASIAMLMPGFGAAHLSRMRNYNHLGCIEVCIRDTNPGQISLGRGGQAVVEKKLNWRAHAGRRDAGAAAIRNILATGAAN